VVQNTFSYWRISSSHSPTCPFRYTDRKTNTLGVGLKFGGLLLSRTIQATLSITRGAGGLSIGANLRYRAIVGHSRAFELLDLVYSNRLCEPVSDPQSFQRYQKTVLQQLQKLFRDGKASPTDIHIFDGDH
jgi:hypothetical protein